MRMTIERVRTIVEYGKNYRLMCDIRLEEKKNKENSLLDKRKNKRQSPSPHSKGEGLRRYGVMFRSDSLGR